MRGCRRRRRSTPGCRSACWCRSRARRRAAGTFAVNVVVAPDSFKGSLSAPQASAALAAGLRRVWPDADIRARPMADGGEGTLDAILHAVGADATRATMALPGASV